MDLDVNAMEDPISHLESAKSFRLHADKGAKPLTPKQKQLIKSIGADPIGCYRRTIQSLQRWRNKKEDLRSQNDQFQSRLPSDLRGTVGKLDAFLIMEMAEAAHHIDVKSLHDLLCGFPAAGEVPCCGTGTPIPGGRLAPGRPGEGKAPDVDQLKARCREINEKTLKRARLRTPKTQDEWATARATWAKLQADTELERVGLPVDVGLFSLDDCLLVDTFGVWKQPGEAMEKQTSCDPQLQIKLCEQFCLDAGEGLVQRLH